MTKAEKTRQYIIEKTAPVFNRKGYSGTSISDLTEITGLTKGSIYGNFSNKDEVALAAFDYNHRKMVSLVNERVNKQNSAAGKLKAYVTAYADFIKEPLLQYGCPVLNTATEADDTHPELRKKAFLAVALWRKSIEGIIKKGQEQKEIRKSTDAGEFALAFIALIEGGVMLWKLTGSSDGLNAALKVAKRMINDVTK